MRRIMSIVVIVFIAAMSYAEVTVNDVLNSAPAEVKEQLNLNISLGLKNQAMLNMYNAMIQNQVRVETQVMILNKLREAYQSGLPTDPVAEKVMEGLAKKVNSAQLEVAVSNVINRYSFAKQIAERVTKEEKLQQRIMNNIADTLAAGMQSRNVETVMTQMRLRSEANLAAEVSDFMKDMARAKVESAEIERSMMVALQKGYTHTELAEIRHIFRNMIKSENANSVAKQMQNGFQAGLKGADMGKNMSVSSGKGGSATSGGSAGSGSGGSSGSSGSSGGSGAGSGGGKGGPGGGKGK
ncbi:MAG: hypothetical protein N3C60_04920 [Calditerrivibrio sp.]|nr:hypothetical protein [Calditerrivibrio sp.]